MKKVIVILLVLCFAGGVSAQQIKVSANGRYFTYADGKPFFWLGDTAWLLLKKVSREETLNYLDTRQKQGFNVIQIMILHDLKNDTNFYGDAALIDGDVSKPLITPGDRHDVADEYDYWDHTEWVVRELKKRGMIAAFVPVWGSNVKAGLVSEAQAKAYAEFLAKRFIDHENIVWLNGGDLRGDEYQPVWQTLGTTLRANDRRHLITFHPRGRTMSSEWFHNESWLDFNMFQSGHRNYAQDNSPTEKHHFGEDNWRYAEAEYNRRPIKPTLDAEPSYENIPQGLHDPKQPRWKDADIRRYAYWSVFAGGAGFTYGENSVMQFFKKGDTDPAYGAELDWRDAINSPGAEQMRFLKQLISEKPFFERIPAAEIVTDQGEKYERIAATVAGRYALFYTYTGRTFSVKTGWAKGKTLRVSWFDPRTGNVMRSANIKNSGTQTFDPPGEPKNGNDHVLILEVK